MAKASVNDTTSKAVESSTAPAFVRNDDPLTIALRSEGTLDLDALVRLHQARPPVSDAAASDGSTSTAVFSSLEASSDTKPTSTSTNYPLYDTEGKCKETIEYSSSLSATHGSGSEAELDMKASQRIDLLGTGSWMSDNSTSKHILKDPTRSRPRNHKKSWSRKKKPPVIVHQDPLSSNLEGASRDGVAVTPLGCEKTHHCRCQFQPLQTHSYVMDQETNKPLPNVDVLYTSMSSMNYYILAGLIVLLALILSFSIVGLRSPGRGITYEDDYVRWYCFDITLHCHSHGCGWLHSTASSAHWNIYDRHWICVTDANRCSR